MPDDRLLPHLCASAKHARENTPGASQQRVASYADISTSTLQRFEAVPPSWMDDTDEIIQAYAYYTHRATVDIWTDALERMKRASGPNSDDGPAGPHPGDAGPMLGAPSAKPTGPIPGRTGTPRLGQRRRAS